MFKLVGGNLKEFEVIHLPQMYQFNKHVALDNDWLTYKAIISFHFEYFKDVLSATRGKQLK